MILEKAKKILTQPVCNHCLGRQFGQLLSGYGNEERGHIIRTFIAMNIDKEEKEKDMDMSNFYEYRFHNLDITPSQRKKCEICNDIFLEIPKITEKIKKASKNINFNTFLIGTKLTSELLEKEEALWERIGIDYCEPLKAELNREIGKFVESEMKKKFEPKNPEVNIIIDLNTKKTRIEINPLFIYGEYQKLVRGIPQTKWPSGKYKTSVEEIIAKPFMKATKGKAHKLHGMGREDIDARCLGWRPFVLEILEPKNRKIDLNRLSKKIFKSIKVRNLRFSSISEVRKIKEARSEKTYLATVVCSKNISKSDLKKISELKEITQKTPQRVLHRRADIFRKRRILSIKTKYINSKKFLLTVRTEAGLYVKELISGDNGRTEPSVSKILGVDCKCKELDVVGIHYK